MRDDDKKNKVSSEVKPETLTDDQISTQKVSRRAVFGAVGAVGVGAASLVAGAKPAEASGPTDSDSGSCSDYAGVGRGGMRSGLTDADSGATCDMSGGGRAGSGWTDSDGDGAITDPAGNGRRGY